MVLEKGVVLTMDNLARRNWNSKTCSFCHSVETIQHLSFRMCLCEIHVARSTYCFWNCTDSKLWEFVSSMVRRAKSEFIHRGSSFLLENLAHKEWSLFLTNANQKLSGEHISFKWAQLHHNDDIKRILIQACQSLEILALHFSPYGWSFSLRFGLWYFTYFFWT